jgi:hypothetical protein
MPFKGNLYQNIAHHAETIKATTLGGNSWIVDLILWGQIHCDTLLFHAMRKARMLMFTNKNYYCVRC